MKKLVSIVILTYNSEEYIEKCLESACKQDYRQFELIIVDNNSTDRTKEILSDIKTKNTNYKIIFNKENLGYNLGNQIGIDNSSGEFIVFLNPDSFLDESWLSNVIQIFEKDEDIMIANGILKNTDLSIQSTGGQIDRYGAVKQRKNNLESYFYAPGSAVIMKRKLFEKCNLDPNLFLYYDDVDLAWQAKLCGYKIGFCENAIAYHVEGHSMHGLTPKKFYFISRNRIYVCSKNYSTNRIIFRTIPILFFVIMDGVYYSTKFKKISYFLNSLKGIFWNIKNCFALSKQRNIIQSIRKVDDNRIEREMEKNSIEFSTTIQ